MKYLYILLGIAAVFVVLGACKSTKKASSAFAKTPVVQLSKGKCFGKCKVYTVRLFDDHSLSFEGVKNVEYIGLHSSELATSAYDELIAKLDAAGLENMEAEYFSEAKDLPELELVYKGKSIRFHKQKAPDDLIQLVALLDEITFAQEWKAVK